MTKIEISDFETEFSYTREDLEDVWNVLSKNMATVYATVHWAKKSGLLDDPHTLDYMHDIVLQLKKHVGVEGYYKSFNNL